LIVLALAFAPTSDQIKCEWIEEKLKSTDTGGMRTDLANLKSFLDQELAHRKKKKPSYSKRAFARDLGINATSLIEFLDGKRCLSHKNIDRVFSYLNKKIYCSWCDKEKTEVKLLIGGPRRQFICDVCLRECDRILKENKILDQTKNKC
jgi:hypothetical protein